MITTYDLESFSTIDLDEAGVSESIPEMAQATQLRLQTVAESDYAQVTTVRDYTPVIAAQLLAKLSA